MCHQFPVNLAVRTRADSVLINCRLVFPIIQLHHSKRKEMVYLQDGHP